MSKRIFFALALFVVCSSFLATLPALAQEVLTNPEVSHAVSFGITPPLRDMPVTFAPAGAHRVVPLLYPKLQQLMERAGQSAPAGDGALQTSAGSPFAPNIGLNFVGVGNGFPGFVDLFAPPDTNAAVGGTTLINAGEVIQVVNVNFAIFDKTTGMLIAGPFTNNTLFSGACSGFDDGDPVIQYDKQANRWVFLQNAGFTTGTYMTCIAVSQTSDATGPYITYDFMDSGFPDYPKLGVFPNGSPNSDAYFYTDNNFGPGGSGFVGAHVCAFERAKMLAGDPTASRICFQTPIFDDSLLPADLDSPVPPPNGEDETYLGSIDNFDPSTKIFAYKFHVDFGTPGNSTFTGVNGTMPITVAQFNLACGGFADCIPQQGVGDLLEALGDRLLYRLAYRHFVPITPPPTPLDTDHRSLVLTHDVNAGTQCGVAPRWYELRAYGSQTSFSVAQQSTYTPDQSCRWMGSIAMDNVGDIMLGYSVSSSSMFPAIRVTGRLKHDPLNTLQAETSIVEGTGSQTDTASRWGDYSSMAVDPGNQCSLWYTTEYYLTTSSFNWSTRLASLNFPSCH